MRLPNSGRRRPTRQIRSGQHERVREALRTGTIQGEYFRDGCAQLHSYPLSAALHRWLATLIVVVCVGATIDACAIPRVIITVDVESNQMFGLSDQLDARCSDGTPCGLTEIARIFNSRGLAATFFLNVYEHSIWGEAAMRDIALKLQAAGHDVELHTHPETAYDANRTEMFDYSLEEQTKIVRDGVRLLSTWTGRPVVAHRAGDYSADENTIEALRRAGLRIDSSLFWKHARSRLVTLGLPRNSPTFVGGVIEIPVTVYERAERPRFLSSILEPIASIRKIDADWFLDEAEVREAIDAIVKADPPFLVVFLHSFSLLAQPTKGGLPEAKRQSRNNLIEILDHIEKRQLRVVTMREVAASGLATTERDQDIVPTVTVRVSMLRYFVHSLRLGTSKVEVLAVAIVGVLILIVGLLVAYRRRLARRREAF